MLPHRRRRPLHRPAAAVVPRLLLRLLLLLCRAAAAAAAVKDPPPPPLDDPAAAAAAAAAAAFCDPTELAGDGTCRAPETAAAFPEYNLTSRARNHRGLDFILGDVLSRAAFFRDYYERGPVLIKRSPRPRPHHYGDLFPFEAVASVIDNFPDQRKLNDWVIVHENFVTPPAYTKVTDYYGAYLKGHTLGMFILNRLWANLGTLVDDLDADFGFPWRVNLYLTPRGAQGFKAHTDQHDFFILQTGGRKKWRVYNNPVPLNTRAQELGKAHGQHLDESELGTPLLDIVMEQGDALYVPRGFIHVADTFADTGSLHLTVRGTNSFFFNMGHVFKYALPEPSKRLGLPKLGDLAEHDVDFRKSTPVHWLDAEPDFERQEDAETAGVALLKFGPGHGGETLWLCEEDRASKKTKRRTTTADGPVVARRRPKKSKRWARKGPPGKCRVRQRWVEALLRAAAAHRKSGRGVLRASRARVKGWLSKHLNVTAAVVKMRALRNKINDEHHSLLDRVDGMFAARGGMRPIAPLEGFVRVRDGLSVRKDPHNTGFVLLEMAAKNKNKNKPGSEQFREALEPVLREIAQRWSASEKPFQLKRLGAADDFERLSLASRLLELKWMDRLEVRQQPAGSAGASAAPKKKKKKIPKLNQRKRRRL